MIIKRLEPVCCLLPSFLVEKARFITVERLFWGEDLFCYKLQEVGLEQMVYMVDSFT